MASLDDSALEISASISSVNTEFDGCQNTNLATALRATPHPSRLRRATFPSKGGREYRKFL